MRIISLDRARPLPALKEAAAVIKAGGLVVFPTESFYAIGADALNAEAVLKVFLAKGRTAQKPLPVIIHDKALIPRYVKDLSPIAAKAVELLTPGPITLIFWASSAFPGELTGGTGRVGIRVPAHEAASGLARLSDGPVTATSANISGTPGQTGALEAAAALGGLVDLVLDAGSTPGPPPSTLLDLTVSPPELIREGRLEISALESALGALKPRVTKPELS